MYIDLFIIIVVVWALWSGWRNGFLKELVSAFGWLVGLFVAATCYSLLGEYLTVDGSQTNMMTSVVAFFLLWIVVPIVLGLIANLMTKALKGLSLGIPNSVLGSVVSLLKYGILVSCVFNVMSSLRILDENRTADSHLFAPVKSVLSVVFDAVGQSGQDVSDDATSDSAPNDTVWLEVKNDANNGVESTGNTSRR